jgi:nucleoside-diphosphate-sugar epimerase
MPRPNIVVTGAGGFLGERLISALLKRNFIVGANGSRIPVDGICAFDQIHTSFEDPRVEVVVGDLSDQTVLPRLIDSSTTSIFHLAAIVSSQAEAEFDLGYAINLDTTRSILEFIRRIGNNQLRFVMTSSVAVYGGVLPAVVTDSTVVTPQSSYGCAKAMSDLLVGDYARRGFVDGLTLRLPTVVVRPGKPNRAASSFASGIIREPIAGEDTVCPVAPSTSLWITSPSAAVANLIHGHDLSPEALTSGRILNLPGISVTVHEMIEALSERMGEQTASRIKMQPDEAIQRIVNSWPGQFDTAYASSLGFVAPANFQMILEQYLQDNETATRGRS